MEQDFNPGFFNDPMTYPGAPGPMNDSNPFPTSSGQSNAGSPAPPLLQQDPLQNALTAAAHRPVSFETMTQPVTFDWEGTNADRYVNSEYYQELGFNPNRDNETLYGHRQTFGDTMQQAFAGAGGLAWNTFWDGWKGWGRMVDSLVNWDASRLMGSREELEELDRQQKEIMDEYAIYRTPESESSLFSRQFLGDMIQQSGFAVGTMAQFAAEELLTMGVATFLRPVKEALGTLPKILPMTITTDRIVTRMKQLGDAVWQTKIGSRLYEGLKGASKVAQGIPVVGNLVDMGMDIARAANKGAGVAELGGMTLNGLRRTLSEANMAFTESRMEAAGTYVELKDKLYQETMQEKGEVSAEDMERIERSAQGAAWSNFKTNAAVISLMNRLEYDNLLRKFGADKRAMRDMAEAGQSAVEKTIDPKYFTKVTGTAAKDVTNAAGKVTVQAGQEFTQVYEKGALGALGNFKQIAADFGRRTAAWEATKSFGKNFFKWEIGEGVQELVQEGSNIAIQQYYKDLYMHGKADGGYVDYVDKAMDELHNVNGLKTFLMGAMTGGLLSPIHRGISFVTSRAFSTAAQREAARTERQGAIQDINEFFVDTGTVAGDSINATIKKYFDDPARYAPEGVANLKLQNNAAKVMEAAIRDNNKYLYEHAKDGAFAKAVIAAKKLNMLGSLTDTLRAYGTHFNEEEFHEAFKVDFKDEQDRAAVKQYMNKLADNVQAFSDRYDRLRYKYADLVRPERYAGEDQERLKLVKRAFDDAIEWMAVSEYRAGRAIERATSIIDEAAKLPTIGSSAHLVFRVLSDNKTVKGEMALLGEEIESLLAAGEPTEKGKQLLRIKQDQYEALRVLTGGGHGLGGVETGAGEDEVSGPERVKYKVDDTKVSFDKMDPESVMDALRDFINAKNAELGNSTRIMPDDLQDVYFKLRDYRQLRDDEREFMDAYSLMAEPKRFLGIYARIQEGLEYLRNEQIARAMLDKIKKEASDTNKDADESDVTEQEVQAGTNVEVYHGYRVGDQIKLTKDNSEHTIVRITTNGMQLLNTKSGLRSTMSLDRFDLLVARDQVSRVEGAQRWAGTLEDESKMQLKGEGLDGIFIVEDNRGDVPVFTLVDHTGSALRPDQYTTEDEAREARDQLAEVRKKEREEEDKTYEFDGKTLKFGTILVVANDEDDDTKKKKKKRYVVLTKGQPDVGEREEAGDTSQVAEEGDNADQAAEDEDADQAAESDQTSIQIIPLGSTSEDDIVRVNNLQGYKLATEVAQRPKRRQKDGLFRLKHINALNRVRGVKKNDQEEQEDADKRLQALILTIPPKDLASKLVLRVRKNHDIQSPRVAGAGTEQENPALRVSDPPIQVELRYNGEKIGYLGYFEEYEYWDEERKVVKTLNLTEDQFREMFDVGDGDARALLEEFKRSYKEGSKVFKELEGYARESGYYDINSKDLEKLFRVHISGGIHDRVVEAVTPLKDLVHNGVLGKRVLLVKPRFRDLKGSVSQNEVVIVEGGMPAPELEQLKARIAEARMQNKVDITEGMGQYQAVVELPNKELRFVPLDTPHFTEPELDDFAKWVSEQSATTKSSNIKIEDGVVDPKSAAFNYAFNNELSKTVFVSIPGSGINVDVSMNPFGDLVFSFDNPLSVRKRQTVVLTAEPGRAPDEQTAQQPLAFSNFDELMSGLEKAIQKFNEQNPDNTIDVALNQTHFKKHLVSDFKKANLEQDIDFGAVGDMRAFVTEGVVKDAYIALTSKSDISDPMELFFLKQTTGRQAPRSTEEVVEEDEEEEAKAEEEEEEEDKDEDDDEDDDAGTPPPPPKGTGSKGEKNTGKKAAEKKTEKKVEKKVEKKAADTPPPKSGRGRVAKLRELESKWQGARGLAIQKLKEEAQAKGELITTEVAKRLRDEADQSAEVVKLQNEINALKDELDRDSIAYKAIKEDQRAHVEDIQKFKKWMLQNLPDYIGLEEMERITANMGKNGITVGQFIHSLKGLDNGKIGMIKTFAGAPYKYHEAFHAVFRLLLTDEQIDRYLDIARKEVKALLKKEGITLAEKLKEMRGLVQEYEDMSIEDLEERLYEEHLADRFDAWKSDYRTEKEGLLQQLFRKIYEFIRKIIKPFTAGELESLFYQINAGKFKYAAVANNRFTNEKQLNAAQQMAFKSIKLPKKRRRVIEDEDGRELKIDDYLSESKSTALASAIAATYHSRLQAARKGNRIESEEELLEGVLNDYAKLYDKDNDQYVALLLDEDVNLYYETERELEKLKDLFEDEESRQELKENIQVHMRNLRLMRASEEDNNEDIEDELGARAMVDFHKNKESIGGFDSLSKWLRQYIATTTYAGKDAFGNTQLTKGEPLLQAVDANRVYSGVLKLVAGYEDLHQMLLRMQVIAQSNTYGVTGDHAGHFIRRFFEDMGVVVTENGYEVQKTDKANMFMMVMKGFQQFTPDYLFFSKELGSNRTKLVSANRREAQRKQFSIWYNAFSLGFQEKYNRTIAAKRPAFLRKRVSGLKNFEQLMRNGQISDESLHKHSHKISQQLTEDLGINLHPLFIQYSLLKAYPKLSDRQKAMLNAFPEVVGMDLQDIQNLRGEIERGKNPFVWNKDMDEVQYRLGERKTAVKLAFRLMDIAASNAMFDETVNTTSFKNAGRETVYAHQLPTFHLLKVRELARSIGKRDLIGDDPYMEGHFLLDNWDMDQMAEDLQVARIDGMNSYYDDPDEEPYAWKQGSTRKGVTYGDFTEREMMLSLFELYGVNKKYVRSDGSVFFTSRHLIRVLEASNTGDTVNLPVFQAVEKTAKGTLKLSKQTRAALLNEVRREFDRIKRVQQEIDQIDAEKKAFEKDGTPRTIKEIDEYHTYGKKGAAPRGLTLFKTRGMLGEALAKELENEAQADEPNFGDFTDRLEKQLEEYWLGKGGQLDQLIERMKAGEIIKQEGNQLKNVLLPSFMGNDNKSQAPLSEPGAQGALNLDPNSLRHNIAQVMMNDFVNTHAFNQLLLGDQAESLTDYVDMVKRAKGANGSGPSTAFEVTAPELGIHHTGMQSHIIQIDDPKFWGRFSGAKFNDASGAWKDKADAQMWMTVKSLRYTLFGLGKLTPWQAALLDKIERGEKVDIEDVFGRGGSIEFDAQTNSIKLMYYDGKRYIKTSGFLLTKELTSYWDENEKDWMPRKGYEELHRLRDKMEKFEERHQTIAMAVPKSASKGEKANTARGVMPETRVTADGLKEIDPITDWNFQQLDNRYWRLQTENPSNKIEITDPTQAKHLILTEQNDDTMVEFAWNKEGKGTRISVGKLKEIYLREMAQRQKVKFQQARNQIFSFQEALDEIKTSADLKKVTPKLAEFQRRAMETLRISGVDSQLLEFFSLDKQGRPLYNLNHPATLDKYTQLFLAYFTKGVMNEKVPGHSVTLVSSYGMRVVKEVLEVDEKGQPKRWRVVMRSEYEQNPGLYADALEWEADPNGTYASEEERKLAIQRREFQGLKSKFDKNQANGIKTYILDDLRHNVPEYALDKHGNILKKNGKEVILGYYTEYMMPPHSREVMRMMDKFGGKIPDVIAKSFGVRIPSQDKHSFVNLKLVDFLPAHYGSSGVFAPELVEISGADFDVDRVYITTKEWYTQEREDGMLEFLEYGKAEDELTQFGEFVRYQKKRNKDFRRRYSELLSKHPMYAEWQGRVDELAELIDDYDEEYLGLLGEKLGDTQKSVDPLKDTGSTTKALEQVIRDNPNAIEGIFGVQSFETSKGSVYTVLPDGKVQRFKTATGELGRPQDLMVFVKFKDLQQEQDYLHALRKSQVYLIDETGKIYNSNEEALGKDVRLAIYDFEQKAYLDFVETSLTPKEGYNTYDQSRFEQDGQHQKYVHIGNPVSKINRIPAGELAQLYHTAKQKGNNPGLVKSVEAAIHKRFPKGLTVAKPGKKLNMNDLRSMANEFSSELVEWKRKHKELVNKLKQAQREAQTKVLKEFSMPTTAELYAKKVKKEGEQHIGKLNNMLVDAKIQLLANEHTAVAKGEEIPIAFQVASVDPLKNLVEDLKKDFPMLKDILEEGSIDIDSLLGKLLAFRNNKEGAKNIGSAVNATLAYAWLNTFKVQMRRETVEEKPKKIWNFRLNGVDFTSYAHDRAWSGFKTVNGKQVPVFEGERILHNISTIVSAMTDNAKERLAAKLGLNIEAVGLVSNLVSQGVPLRSAVIMMLQPVVREYYAKTRNLSASVKTEEEEEIQKYAIGQDMLDALARKLGNDRKTLELTDDMMRDNILTKGDNLHYQYTVLDSFLKLKRQSEYFNHVSGVMKVVKGMQTSHEADNKLEEKINALGLRDDNNTFNQKYIPFDLRQVMMGVDKKKPHSELVVQYISNFDQTRHLSELLFIERTEAFKHIFNHVKDNLRVRGYQGEEFNKKLKRDLLSYLTIKAYKKLLKDSNRLNRAASLTHAMVFDGEADKMPEGFKDIVSVVQEIRKWLPDNAFVHQFLNVLPTHVEDEDGYVENPYNRTGVNKAEINTWAKLDADQIEKLQSSFMDIWQHPRTNELTWSLFHYLLVKDGGQFRNGSFIRYIPNFMFKDLLDATGKVNEVMLAGSEEGEQFEEVFDMQVFELTNDFMRGYLLNATNSKYVLQVDLNKATKDLKYKESVPKEGDTDEDAEIKKEVKKYVPGTFVVSKNGELIDINMKAGLPEKGDYDKLQKAKYGKNMESLKQRGFKSSKEGKTLLKFPFVIRHEETVVVDTDYGPEERTYQVYYVLSEVDGKNIALKNPTALIKPGMTVTMGAKARYKRFGAPEGSYAQWGGAFVFGIPDTSTFPRERPQADNYGGYDMDAPVTPATEGGQGTKKGATDLPVLIVDDFQQEYGVDYIEVVDGQMVFSKDGEVLPDQEKLRKAFMALSKAQSQKEEKDASSYSGTEEYFDFDKGWINPEDDEEDSFSSEGTIDLDEVDDDTPSEEEEQKNLNDDLNKDIDDSPLGCEGNDLPVF